MLFHNIAALIAKGVTLQLTVSQADGDKLEVGLIPMTETGKSGMNLIAKSFVGTATELDAEFATVIAGYAAANLSLMGQLQAVQTMADAAAKEASEAAAQAAATKAAAKALVKSVAPGTKTLPGTPARKVTPSLDDDDPDGKGDGKSDGAAVSAPSGASAAPAGQGNLLPFDL